METGAFDGAGERQHYSHREQKGYGFVNSDENTEQDIFAHFSAIEMDGYKTLKQGQQVEFDLAEGPKGLTAAHIRAAAAAT